MNINLFKKIIAYLNFYGIKLLDGILFYGGKIAGRFIFPVVLVKNLKIYVNSESYYPESELKSKGRIFLEQLIYIFITGEIHKEYFFFGFDRKNKTDFLNYVPRLTYTHKRNKKNQLPVKPEYNPCNYVCLLRDKFIFGGFCRSIGLNTPQNVGVINEGKLYLTDDNLFTSPESITDLNIDAFCKRNVPYGGGMPDNIFKLNINNKEIKINDEISNFEKLISLFGNDHWIIQNRIKNQAKAYADFHPQSINTIRIITVKDGSDIEIICAILRIGTNGKFVDNSSSGGLAVDINTENGKLDKWGFYMPGHGTKTAYHPDSKIVFEGYHLPLWNDTVAYAKKAHSLFYGLHSIGWDIAVTDDGITIIEGNDNWDTSDAQFYKEKYRKYFTKQKHKNNL